MNEQEKNIINNLKEDCEGKIESLEHKIICLYKNVNPDKIIIDNNLCNDIKKKSKELLIIMNKTINEVRKYDGIYDNYIFSFGNKNFIKNYLFNIRDKINEKVNTLSDKIKKNNETLEEYENKKLKYKDKIFKYNLQLKALNNYKMCLK